MSHQPRTVCANCCTTGLQLSLEVARNEILRSQVKEQASRLRQLALILDEIADRAIAGTRQADPSTDDILTRMEENR